MRRRADVIVIVYYYYTTYMQYNIILVRVKVDAYCGLWIVDCGYVL